MQRHKDQRTEWVECFKYDQQIVIEAAAAFGAERAAN